MLEFFLSVVPAGSKVVHQVAGQVVIKWSTRWSGGSAVVHQVGGGGQVTFGRLDLVMMVQHVMPTRWCLVMILPTGSWSWW